MTKYKINEVLIFFVMSIICLNLTVEHWQNFQNYERENKNFYVKFDNYLNENINRYEERTGNFQRDYDGLGSDTLLEEREKTRWLLKHFKMEIMINVKKISQSQNYYPHEKAALYIYSIFIGLFYFLIFIFLYLSLNKINCIHFNVKPAHSNHSYQSIFLFFSYFLTIGYINFIHHRGGEDWYSIFETLFLIMGIYLVLKNSKFSLTFYVLICLLAPLARESGIIVSGIYICYHFIIFGKIKFYGFIIPIISLIPYLISNYDILQYYLSDGFIFTTQDIPHQTTWRDLATNFVGTMVSIFYNFIIFFIVLILFYKHKNKLQLFLLLFILIYFVLLAYASVLDHLTTRFMPACLMILYVYVGLIDNKLMQSEMKKLL